MSTIKSVMFIHDLAELLDRRPQDAAVQDAAERPVCDEDYEKLTGLLAECQPCCNLSLSHHGPCHPKRQTVVACAECGTTTARITLLDVQDAEGHDDIATVTSCRVPDPEIIVIPYGAVVGEGRLPPLLRTRRGAGIRSPLHGGVLRLVVLLLTPGPAPRIVPPHGAGVLACHPPGETVERAPRLCAQ
jgi:hypothetical protein